MKPSADEAQQLQVAQGSLPALVQPPSWLGAAPPCQATGQGRGRSGAGAGSSAAAGSQRGVRGRRGGMGRLAARRLVLLAACLGLCGALGGTRPNFPSPSFPRLAARGARWKRVGGEQEVGRGRGDPLVLWGPQKRQAGPVPLRSRLKLSGRVFIPELGGRGRRLLRPAQWLRRRRRAKLPTPRSVRPGPSDSGHAWSPRRGPCYLTSARSSPRSWGLKAGLLVVLRLAA